MKTRDEIERQRHQDQALAGLRESLRPIADDKGYDLDGLLTMVLESRWDADAVAIPRRRATRHCAR